MSGEADEDGVKAAGATKVVPRDPQRQVGTQRVKGAVIEAGPGEEERTTDPDGVVKLIRRTQPPNRRSRGTPMKGNRSAQDGLNLRSHEAEEINGIRVDTTRGIQALALALLPRRQTAGPPPTKAIVATATSS